MKKLIVMILALALTLSMASVFISADPVTTVGYSSARVEKVNLDNIPNITKYYDYMVNPPAFKITTPEGLLEFSEIVNSNDPFYGVTIYLANSIDMTGITNFTPIGKGNSTPFGGTFDGQGHMVDNLVYSSADEEVGITGFFGSTAGATIKNFVIGSNCSFTYTGNKAYNRTAALVGNFYKSQVPNTIENCMNLADVSGKHNVGAFVGVAESNNNGENKIINCTNTGKITGEGCIGGIVAFTDNTTVTIENCRNAGDVSCTAKAIAIGNAASGFVGRPRRAVLTIRNSINNGAISGPGSVSGFLGNIQLKGTIELDGCTNYGTITATVAGGQIGALVGPVVSSEEYNEPTVTNSFDKAGNTDASLATDIETVIPDFTPNEGNEDITTGEDEETNPPVTESATTTTDVVTNESDATVDETTIATKPQKSGCKSAASGTVITVVCAAGAILTLSKKKKTDK